MLHLFAHLVACCCAKFETGQTFQPTTPNISFVPWSPKQSAQCWICLHNSSNIVGAMHAHYAWITKTYGLYSFHNALQVPNLSGIVASVCTPLPTCTQQLPTSLDQQCWELLCCAHLHAALGIVQRCGKGGGHGAIKHNYLMYVIFSAFPFAH